MTGQNIVYTLIVVIIVIFLLIFLARLVGVDLGQLAAVSV